jgi:hypothetical protein
MYRYVSFSTCQPAGLHMEKVMYSYVLGHETGISQPWLARRLVECILAPILNGLIGHICLLLEHSGIEICYFRRA